MPLIADPGRHDRRPPAANRAVRAVLASHLCGRRLDRLAPVAAAALHYPATALEHSALARAIFTLIDDAEARAAFRGDPARYAARFDLAEGERAALVALDRDVLRECFQVNPMPLYQLAQRVA